jgi:hypothetical protein
MPGDHSGIGNATFHAFTTQVGFGIIIRPGRENEKTKCQWLAAYR